MVIMREGHSIDCQESGYGPTLVFLPGSFSTTAAWDPISQHLESRFRLVATSLLGCGRTDERRQPGDASIDHQLRAIDAVLEVAGEPLHLVGHSWGGALAMLTALNSHCDIRSLTLIDANPCTILLETDDAALCEEMLATGTAYCAAHAAGEPQAARRIIDFFTGQGAFDALPEKVRDYAVATTKANVLDWESFAGTELSLKEVRRLDLPCLVLAGRESHPVLQRIAHHLEVNLPRAERHTIEGASHFLITSHAEEIAGHIAAHIAAVN